MKDLIERLEKASGPDRELDRDIARASGWFERDGIWYQPIDGFDYPNAYVPKYSASLDASLALVPEGWEWALYFEGGKYRAEAGDPLLAIGAEADSPALALCIAFLQARDV